MIHYYAVTIKCIRKGWIASEDETEEVYNALLYTYRATSFKHTFEKDRLGRYHLHGCILVTRKNIKYSLFKKQYWHIHIDYLPTHEDRLNWLSYIQKDESEEFIKRLRDGEYVFQ